MKRTPEPRDPVARHVWRERYARFWSIRDAAEGSGVSNQTWSAWEKVGGAPTDNVREAVARRFGWPADWPENLPALSSESVSSLDGGDVLDRVERLERVLTATLLLLRKKLEHDEILDRALADLEGGQPVSL